MTKKKDRNIVQVELTKEVKEEFKKKADKNGISMAKWIKVKIDEFIKEK